MVNVGDVLKHPIYDYQVTVVSTGAEMVLDLIIPGGMPSTVAAHYHETQAEAFEVTSGRARYELNGEQKDLLPGERLVFAAGVHHINPWNGGDEPLHMRTLVTPGLDHEIYYVTGIRAAQRGYVRPSGSLPLLHQAVLTTDAQGRSYLLKPSPAVQKVLFPILAFFGRLKGYRASYPD